MCQCPAQETELNEASGFFVLFLRSGTAGIEAKDRSAWASKPVRYLACDRTAGQGNPAWFLRPAFSVSFVL